MRSAAIPSPRARSAAVASALALASVATLGCDTPARELPVSDSVWGETTLVEDLRIGRYDGPSEYLFASINSVVQLEDGSIVIADESRASSRVRRYDAGGVYLNDVGRMGQGPGEYQRASDARSTPDGNVVIWDTRSRRVTTMSPEGEYISSFQADSGLNASSLLLVDTGGNIYIRTLKEDQDDPLGQRIHGYLKYSPSGELLDTIWLPKSGLRRNSYWVSATSDGHYYPFVRKTASGLTTDGTVVSGDNDGYRLDWSRGGEPMFTATRPWEPIPLHPEELDEWRRRLARVERVEIPASVPIANWMPSKYLPIPETKPAFMDVWPGDQGTLWVRRYTEAHKRTDLAPREEGDNRPRMTWWQYLTFDVFDREGLFLGTVTVPHGSGVVWRHPDYLWTVQRDAHDEAVAVRFRIVKESEGER